MTSLNEFYQQVRESRLIEPVLLDEPVSIEDLHTPALVIDLDVFDANLVRMQNYLEGENLTLRAHTKMHKCPIIARKQVEAGAVGTSL